MFEKLLQHRLVFLLAATMWGGGAFLFPGAVNAETPLTRAVVQSIRNTVRLLLRNQTPRPARVQDALTPGDALSTARLSLAELRFNDGSLARVGEQALFQFLPNTRTFRLNTGTVLLLIPPGRGRTQLQTPNAIAGIRGSALFVRYVPETDTTLVGALTNSGIEVNNRDCTQVQPLAAGQMVIIIQNRIERVYHFDLRTFYETSDLVKGLNLSRQEPVEPTDPAVALFQEETVAAVNAQEPISNSNALQNPAFLRGADGTAGSATETTSVPSLTNSPVSSPPNPADLTVLQPATVSRPSIFPPSVAIPPRQTSISPGLSGNTAGREGDGPPGLTGTVPGLSGNAPRPGGNGPPGLTGTAPGLSGNAPGREGNGPPGLTKTAPGLAGTTPGGR
ncbi:FecR domain-containing protein [Leptothermofonsia sp. ETS-13]|uniref:FecR domain-containing protein n=1 Tax=Leptothermofonsia sp. ETS-13 TaxID=3035696 RepID=UPI003BA1A7C0